MFFEFQGRILQFVVGRYDPRKYVSKCLESSDSRPSVKPYTKLKPSNTLLVSQFQYYYINQVNWVLFLKRSQLPKYQFYTTLYHILHGFTTNGKSYFVCFHARLYYNIYYIPKNLIQYKIYLFTFRHRSPWFPLPKAREKGGKLIICWAPDFVKLLNYPLMDQREFEATKFFFIFIAL